jgi:hypothetical protein
MRKIIRIASLGNQSKQLVDVQHMHAFQSLSRLASQKMKKIEAAE